MADSATTLFCCALLMLVFVMTNASRCPDPQTIRPCSCSMENMFGKVMSTTSEKAPTTQCMGIHDFQMLRNVLSASGDQPFVAMQVHTSAFNFFPASALEEKGIRQLYLRETPLVGLFDRVPEENHKLNALVLETTILRGIEWPLLRNFRNLTTLAIDQVVIRSLGKEFMENVPTSIESILFTRNRLSRLDDRVFAELTQLVSLFLGKQEITTLKRSMFPRENKIEHLKFDTLRLSSLPDDLFEDMPHLKIVMLDNNQITTVSYDVFNKLQDNVDVFLRWNKIVCDCKLRWIMKKKLNLDASCDTPQSFHLKKIGDPNGFSDKDLDYCNDGDN